MTKEFVTLEYIIYWENIIKSRFCSRHDIAEILLKFLKKKKTSIRTFKNCFDQTNVYSSFFISHFGFILKL